MKEVFSLQLPSMLMYLFRSVLGSTDRKLNSLSSRNFWIFLISIY